MTDQQIETEAVRLEEAEQLAWLSTAWLGEEADHSA